MHGGSSAILLLILACAVCSVSAYMTALGVQQSADNTVTLSLINVTSGNQLEVSPLKFQFPFPLIEVSADATHGLFYVVAFPVSEPGAVVYELNSTTLETVRQWHQPAGGAIFFDFQYSSLSNCLYGILVNGTYGRILSRFTLSDTTITPTPLITLPLMWYVNASSYDRDHDIYYGLLNNFQPSFAGQQKLVIANFSQQQPQPTAQVLDITSSSAGFDDGFTLHFLAYSAPGSQLYATAQLGSQAGTYLGFVDVFTEQGTAQATFTPIALLSLSSDPRLSPIWADNMDGTVCALCSSDSTSQSPAVLACVDVFQSRPNTLLTVSSQSYDKFVAVAFFPQYL